MIQFGLILCILIISVTGITDEMKEMAKMLHETCTEETGATDDQIERARKGDFPPNDEFKCYIKCILAQMACISDDGMIDVEATIAVLPEEFKADAEPIIRKCGTVVGANACDNAWLTHKCYYEMNPSAYFLV
uniref:Odorant-binding protein 19 n=1 Tax=Dastarcus helophoroides TaxID=1169899 RepID=A0A1I9HZP7_9CUCU|nr:odorant-binding protein 19 [Dastarcus helophoroides]